MLIRPHTIYFVCVSKNDQNQKKKKGFVIRNGDFHYSFFHDWVQEAAKSAIPEEIKMQMHLEIGLFLLDKINDLERKVMFFHFKFVVHVYNPDTRRSANWTDEEEEERWAGL